ncbi:uncharacterized protein LOC110111333 [Dendrobium catenatum]|uniref:uncharacterized protein LOC110111333 n=1 Tax=Dendrobium catenatum TaxID=906689 RepID=UPI0010A01012|nr:uncharacterized protein LOC110111333 [Dendrobium catenatum]
MTPPCLAAWNVRGFNRPEKVRACKDLVRCHKLDLICVLENMIHNKSLMDPWFRMNHEIFVNEESCHNFNLSKSGRIWIKWNPMHIHFIPTICTSQLISGNLYSGTELICVLSVIYASNDQADRLQLWDKIRELGVSISSPWLILGDFNCCLNASEKSGGTPLLASQLWDFNSLLFDVCLFDLASIGLKFSWFNQRANDPIHLKLDRMLINDKWLESFPTSRYKTKQDEFWHVLLDIFSQPIRGNPILGLYSKLKNLKLRLKGYDWTNSSLLSNQFISLKEQQSCCLGLLNNDPQNLSLNQRLKGINAQIADCSSSWTNWMLQRAKIKWLSQGEDDLKFLYARVRRRRNICSSKLVASDDPNVRINMVSSIIEHFEKLFNAPNPPACCDPLPIPEGNIIPPHLASLLTAPISDDDIKAVIFHGSSNSSPGPDGFNFEFYKSSWLFTGPLICKAVKSFFSKGYLPKFIKASAIALIPKTAHASNITDFRPIALCNVFYKIITKIMALRMKDFMPLIIGENQGGFIKNRIGTDNALLASEILLDFKKAANRKFMCVKLDIRKAFDSVSRDFILFRMKQKGFPSTFINWTKACIYDVPFSICIDGALEGYFHSTSGIRQGCPLSPYLFCIAMDAFTCMIDNHSAVDRFMGIHKKDLVISHLLYADDLLIFGEATVQNCKVLVDILDGFAQLSGLKVNHEKSNLIISKSISNPLLIAEALNISSFGDKMTYLGIPISVKKLSKADYQLLLNTISKHLAGWKARLLSFAGRLQFVKYTICNTIIYWVRGTMLSKSCIRNLNRMCSRFLYFGDVEARKVFLIAWNNTCKPKHLGGLGIPNLLGLQFANTCSLVLRFYNSNSMLFKFLNVKYGTPWTPILGKASSLWCDMNRIAIQINPIISFELYSNIIVSLLWDPWFHGKSIMVECANQNLNTVIPCHATVSDFTGHVGWLLPSLISEFLADSIQQSDSSQGVWRERNERRFNFKTRCSTTLSMLIKNAVDAKIIKWKATVNLQNSSSVLGHSYSDSGSISLGIVLNLLDDDVAANHLLGGPFFLGNQEIISLWVPRAEIARVALQFLRYCQMLLYRRAEIARVTFIAVRLHCLIEEGHHIPTPFTNSDEELYFLNEENDHKVKKFPKEKYPKLKSSLDFKEVEDMEISKNSQVEASSSSEVTQIKLRSGKQVYLPQKKIKDNENVSANMDYNQLSHLHKLPTLLSDYDAIRISKNIWEILIKAL